MKKILALLVFAILPTLVALSQRRIIDMHIHSYTESDFGEREAPTDHYGVKGSVNAEQHRLETFAAFERFNIVKAVVSGNPESVKNWKGKDDKNRVIRGILSFLPIGKNPSKTDGLSSKARKSDLISTDMWAYPVLKSPMLLGSGDQGILN